MLSLTHATFSAMTVALTLCTADMRLIGLGALAGLLPDVDTPNSWPGRLLFPISAVVSRWGHRQITHSLMGTAIAWVCFSPLLWLGSNWYWAAAIGYLSGWLLDAASKTGVPIFYPSLKRLVFPLDPEFRLKTGSTTERLLLALLALILVLLVHVNVSGGAIASFSNWLGSSSGAVDAYHRSANQREVYALVTGFHRLTQEPVQQRMQVIGTASETDLLVRDREGHLYQAGTSAAAHIRTSRVQVELGRSIRVQVQPVQIPQPAALSELTNAVGSGYATGELVTEAGDVLSSQTDPRFHQAVTVQHVGGKQAKLSLESATAQDLQSLPEIEVQGSVVVRRFQ